MKLKIGGFYKDENGEKQGPMWIDTKGEWRYDGSNGCFRQCGASKFNLENYPDPDLITEWTEPATLKG